MAYTERNMALEPGLIFGCLDGGGMLVDRNSGEYLPAEQVIFDPAHIDQMDFLDESGHGYLKGSIADERNDGDDDNDGNDFGDDDEEESGIASLYSQITVSQGQLSYSMRGSGGGQSSRGVSVRKQKAVHISYFDDV